MRSGCELRAAVEAIGGFDAGMRVARHRYAGVDFYFGQQSHVFPVRHVGLGQDGPLDPGRHLRIRFADSRRRKARRGAQHTGGKFSS
jgi:hypothetical protein